eukprot:36074-Eustigmatos_ZCMA.PRE.1
MTVMLGYNHDACHMAVRVVMITVMMATMLAMVLSVTIGLCLLHINHIRQTLRDPSLKVRLDECHQGMLCVC